MESVKNRKIEWQGEDRVETGVIFQRSREIQQEPQCLSAISREVSAGVEGVRISGENITSLRRHAALENAKAITVVGKG